MATFTVFYSWQSDRPRTSTRDVVHSTLQSAIARMGTEASIEDAPRLDHDTLDVPGTPQVQGALFDKIDRCGIFVADVSFVGTANRENVDGKVKLLPNVNVMMELGYAARVVGWGRVILVMNGVYGGPESLPFDLRNRTHPISYLLSEGSGGLIPEAEAILTNELQAAILGCMNAEHSLVSETVEQLDRYAIDLVRRHGSDTFHHRVSETMGEVVLTRGTEAAIVRLLELRLLRCTHVKKDGSIAWYDWTYLGRLVAQRLSQ